MSFHMSFRQTTPGDESSLMPAQRPRVWDHGRKAPNENSSNEHSGQSSRHLPRGLERVSSWHRRLHRLPQSSVITEECKVEAVCEGQLLCRRAHRVRRFPRLPRGGQVLGTGYCKIFRNRRFGKWNSPTCHHSRQSKHFADCGRGQCLHDGGCNILDRTSTFLAAIQCHGLLQGNSYTNPACVHDTQVKPPLRRSSCQTATDLPKSGAKSHQDRLRIVSNEGCPIIFSWCHSLRLQIPFCSSCFSRHQQAR